jgi:Sec-independent protein translocase protein TatA
MRGYDVEPEPELILEDATSLRDAMRRMARYASDVTEALDARIEEEDLDGKTEAEELREALERVQNLTLELSEELDAYQDRHAS